MKYILTSLFLVLFTYGTFAQTTNIYVKASQDFLSMLQADENTDEIVQQFASWTTDELDEGLPTDNERFAFWLNIYNGYIQRILGENPKLYEDRRSFFKEKFIDIGGRKMAFADIEHGIIRHSQFEYFLGYITNPFAPIWERKLRVKKRDWRIHFALNCGAKSCPPVAIYDNTILNEQLNKSTKMYLEKFTKVEPAENTVYATSLFSWFRGDFGGKSGTKKILKQYGIIDNTDIDLKFATYDWTLDLDNYIDLK